MTSLIHLEAIWRAKQEHLFNEISKHAKEWNNEKKCECMFNKPFPDELYECSHLQKDREKIFRKKIKKQFKDAYLLSSISLSSLREQSLNL